jgi:membrane protein DedA with SNARE-associated domain
MLELVSRFGYVIVFLGVAGESAGVPLPGETVLVAAAVAAGRGRLDPWVVAIVAWTAAVAGDNLGYAVGRRYGRGLFDVRGIRRVYTAERAARSELFFARWGWQAVFVGRFVTLLRMFAGPLAGMSGMPWARFLVANAAGAGVWVGTVTAVGVAFSDSVDRAARLVERAGYGVLDATVVAAATVLVVQLRRLRAR